MGIKKATINDVGELSKLFDEYRVFYEKKSDINAAAIFLKDRIFNDESVIYISFINEKTFTGFVQLYPIFSSTRMKRLWLLNDLFVKEEYRKQGIAEALIKKAKELAMATNSCGLILETAKPNAAANTLYLKTGWVLDTEHNFYSWKINA